MTSAELKLFKTRAINIYINLFPYHSSVHQITKNGTVWNKMQ